ncbi:hypothetical protein LSH36_951g00000 [Paralvinella palmiformis]|uniref:Protein kinase domain-containing protein n=1 Tax=Paralvinella palmiformis TaxID=53620 RepID=A0AAD9IXK4_9ANNE|nr:hypothetical protein LSH36_951g00000 [Paralvinella palmiformis]
MTSSDVRNDAPIDAIISKAEARFLKPPVITIREQKAQIHFNAVGPVTSIHAENCDKGTTKCKLRRVAVPNGVYHQGVGTVVDFTKEFDLVKSDANIWTFKFWLYNGNTPLTGTPVVLEANSVCYCRVLIMEVAVKGNLKQYLENKPDETSTSSKYTMFVLINFMKQIIEGVKAVHELDLPRPIPWLSPEAIVLQHVLESDVWSFGVLMWEILSPGKEPFEGFESDDIRQTILNGEKLGVPETCPSEILWLGCVTTDGMTLTLCGFLRLARKPDTCRLILVEYTKPMGLCSRRNNNILPAGFEGFISSEIVTESLLSEDNYYRVWRGKLVDKHNLWHDVVIKTEKGNRCDLTLRWLRSNDQYTRYLIKQAEHLIKLRSHGHIIGCQGITPVNIHKALLSDCSVCFLPDFKALVMEVASLGNLRQYLEVKATERSSKSSKAPSIELNFITQIIEGVQAVHNLNPPCLFYCLSASHVLLSADQKCKLSGFANLRTVRQREEWEEKNQLPRPIPWLSPEAISLEHKRKSDIWSLGILMWEIYSKGRQMKIRVISMDYHKT